MPGALDGLLVADFSRVLAGPLCTMTLGDLGADVVKVERRGVGDDTRSWGPPFADGTSTYYLGLNRNKRSLALDLAEPRDVELARRLAARADVVVESFRPGIMARWGLDHESVAAVNPRVVTCSISAFGSSAEAAELPGYDLLLQAAGGLMSVTGEAGGRPLKVGTALIDMLCGLHATIAVLAGLQARERDGVGQRVEVNLMDNALAGLLNQGSAYLLAGVVGQRLGNAHPSIAPYETFPAADGELAVACGNDAIFQRLCGVLGLETLVGDPRFATNAARLEHRELLAETIAGVLRKRPAADWAAIMADAGVPAGPIRDIAGAFALAEALGLDPVAEVDGVRTVRSPLRLAGTPVAHRRRPPALGEHDAELRAWLLSEPGPPAP